MNQPRDFLSRFRKFFQKRSQEASTRHTQEREALVFRTSTDHRMPSLAQLRYLPAVFTNREFRIFWTAIAIGVISIGLFAYRWYDSATILMPEVGGTYTEGIVGVPQNVNPILAPLSDVDSDLSSLIFSSLVKLNDHQQMENDLITNYTISEDELTYTFFLRSDVYWHDGERLDAGDAVFTIRAIQDPLYQSPLRSTLEDVTAKQIDDFSFSLTLEEPFAPFLSTLTFGLLPEHLWGTIPGQNVRLNGLNLQPVGSGPYQFSELTKDAAGNVKSFVVTRNESYYADVPYIKNIKFLFYADVPTAVEALQNKNIEGLSFVPKESKEVVQEKNDKLQNHSLRVPQYTALFFNQGESEVLQELEVRQALSRAVDRDELIDNVLGGEALPIYTPILPGYVGHNSGVKRYPFDLEKSRKLLKDAGWFYPDGRTGEEEDFVPREKDGVKLEITISTVDLPEYQEVLALLQQHWQEIGAKVNVDTYSPQDIQTDIIQDRTYEALLFGEIVGSDPDPYPFWHSTQQEHPGLALAIFRNTDLDTLIEDARKTNDEEVRNDKYHEFQEILAEEQPAIFLYNPHYTYMVHEKVLGMRDDQYIAVPSDRFSNVSEWYIEHSRTFHEQ